MPTVVIGHNTGDDYSGIEDNRLVQLAATTNYGTNNRFDMHEGVTNQYSYGIIRVTGLSNISAPVTVSSAVLSLCQATGGYTQTYSFRRLLRAWSVSQSTWNIYSTGNNWSTAGGISDGYDRVSDVSATLTSGSNNGVYYKSGDLSADVEDFINGDLTNNGWHGERSDGSGDSQNNRYHSSESDDGYRPYLTVTYEESSGTSIGPLVGASALVGGGVLCGQGNLIN